MLYDTLRVEDEKLSESTTRRMAALQETKRIMGHVAWAKDVLLDEKFVEECNHLKTMLLLAVPGESGAPEERHFKEAATSRVYLLQHKPNSFHKVLTLFGAGMYLAKKISEMIQATLCTQISNI